MLRMIFQNELGKITMSDTWKDDFFINQYDGLDYIPPEFNTEVYVNENGRNTTSKYIPGRTITLKVMHENKKLKVMDNAIKVLSRKGTLVITNGNKTRKIECNCAGFEKGDRNQSISSRALQFVCDKVNFEDLRPTKSTLFEIVGNIKNTFTFPMKFSEATNEKDIFNIGYLLIQPTILIQNTKVSEGNQAGEYGFEILNTTHNQKIRLNYHTRLNEIIKIDVYNREITSILNGVETDLINYISEDTNLENFFFEVGKNHIKFVNYNIYETLIATTEYSNLWIEVL